MGTVRGGEEELHLDRSAPRGPRAELVISHPDEHEHGWPLVVLIGGPLLYLLGEAAFRWRMARKISAARLTVAGALLLLAVPAGALPALAVGAIQAMLLGSLAVYELRTSTRVREKVLNRAG